MTTGFAPLGLQPSLVQGLTELGYVEPTPIQEAMIPRMLAGLDVIGQAQTGTGKTAAFALPILQGLEPGRGPVQCLVLTPTRELAMQVARAMAQYGERLGVRVLAVYGGQPYGVQIRQLDRGVDVVVGTPGRLIDLIEKKVLNLSEVRTVVLDEADEMLSMGFVEDIERLLSETPDTRQTALFSATLPKAIRELAERYMRAPESVAIEREQRTAEGVTQRHYLVNEEDKPAALSRLLEVEPVRRALVFVRTRQRTRELADTLAARGFRVEALSGEMSQDARSRVLARLRSGDLQLLVATDVAARGLDVDDISHVFNVDLPTEPEVYVHRVGRTGRAGREGLAIALLEPRERGRLRRIEAYARQEIPLATLPSEEEIWDQRDQRLRERVAVWLQRGRCNREREMVAGWVEEGIDPSEIAAVALKMARAEEKQRPIEPIGELRRGRPERPQRGAGPGGRAAGAGGRRGPRRDRALEEDMVGLKLDLGREQGLRTNDVVRTIARQANIPGSTLGKIRIHARHTRVDVPRHFVDKVLALDGSLSIGERRVAVGRA